MDQTGADGDGRFTGSSTLCVLLHFVSRIAGFNAQTSDSTEHVYMLELAQSFLQRCSWNRIQGHFKLKIM